MHPSRLVLLLMLVVLALAGCAKETPAQALGTGGSASPAAASARHGAPVSEPRATSRELGESLPQAAAASPEVAARAPAIVFLGDSLTAGLGLEEEQAIPALIQNKLAAAGLGYRAVNAGRSGDTSAGGLARIDWYLRDTVDLRVLVIGLGSNDALRGLSLESLEQNLSQLIQRVRQRRPAVKILLWEMKIFPNMGADYQGKYEAVFTRVAENEHVGLIPFPLAGVAGERALNQADGVHPTAAGAERVAEKIWEALRPEL